MNCGALETVDGLLASTPRSCCLTTAYAVMGSVFGIHAREELFPGPRAKDLSHSPAE
jgi:hypothetical protein